MKHRREKVAITGLGVVSPLCPFLDTKEFWHALCSGTDAVKPGRMHQVRSDRKWPVARIDVSEYPVDIGVEDRFPYVTEWALRMSMADAGLEENGSKKGEIEPGLAIGTVLGNMLYKEIKMCESGNETLARGTRNETGTPGKESLSFLTRVLSEKYNIRGPVVTVSTACASGTDSVGIASRLVESGQAEVMIAGGAEMVNDFALSGFHCLQAITKDKVKPFDRKRSGLALGEGAAFLVLESESSARRRRANIYGYILSYSSRSDAHHLTGPHREGRGLAEAMYNALKDASLKPEQVNYISAHGTGTIYNDLMETKAIKKVFGEVAYDIPVSSIKSMLGHSFGAAGSLEIITCILSIQNGEIPPTINLFDFDPLCDLDYVPVDSRKHEVGRAISLSAGFGGQNSAVVIGAP